MENRERVRHRNQNNLVDGKRQEQKTKSKKNRKVEWVEPPSVLVDTRKNVVYTKRKLLGKVRSALSRSTISSFRSLYLYLFSTIYILYSTFQPPLSLSVSTLTQRDSSVKCLSFSLATHRPVILYNSLSIQGGFARVYEVVSSDTTQPRLAAKVHFFL